MLIFLLGYMGSGKTTFGSQLSKRLQINFYDMDILIEHKFKVNINQLFKKYSEEVFRVIEQGVLIDVFKMENAVISTGGGTPCYKNNMEMINRHGISVYLKINTEHIYERLKRSKKKRPLIAGLNKKELYEYIKTQLKLREEFYNRAHFIHDPYKDDIEILIEKISGKNLTE